MTTERLITETLTPTELGKRTYNTMQELAELLSENPYFRRNAAINFFNTSGDGKSIRFYPTYATGEVSYDFVARFDFSTESDSPESTRKLTLTLQRLSRDAEKDFGEFADDGTMELISEVRGRQANLEYLNGQIRVPGREPNTEDAFTGMRDFLKGFYPVTRF